MKNQNRRNLEKQWSNQAKKAAKETVAGKQPTGKPQVGGRTPAQIGGQKRGS
jgi:hypothetical protein